MRILVCGAGLMGHGIAQVLAAAGHDVRLYEPEAERAEAGVERIAGNLQRDIAAGRTTPSDAAATLGRITPSDDLVAAAGDAAVVIEAIVEDEAAKRALFAALDTATTPATVLASNTSSIPIERLAGAAAVSRRERVIGLHFFSPVPRMALVEVIRGRDTSDATEQAIRALAADLGKEVIVSRDRPGFLVNRILMPFLAEAMRALEEGVGSAADIDTGARVGLGHPMGPLALADHIGLDVCLRILDVLRNGLDDPRFEPPASLQSLVAAGHLGRKTGRGFHEYAAP